MLWHAFASASLPPYPELWLNPYSLCGAEHTASTAVWWLTVASSECLLPAGVGMQDGLGPLSAECLLPAGVGMQDGLGLP